MWLGQCESALKVVHVWPAGPIYAKEGSSEGKDDKGGSSNRLQLIFNIRYAGRSWTHFSFHSFGSYEDDVWTEMTYSLRRREASKAANLGRKTIWTLDGGGGVRGWS